MESEEVGLCEKGCFLFEGGEEESMSEKHYTLFMKCFPSICLRILFQQSTDFSKYIWILLWRKKNRKFFVLSEKRFLHTISDAIYRLELLFR